MTVFKKTIQLTLEELKFAQTILEMEEGHYEEAGKDEVIKRWSVDFEKGFEMDIKLCNGDTPYIDSVLFLNGEEIDVLDVSEELTGIYSFEVGQNQYSLLVEVPDIEWSRTKTEDEMEEYLISNGYNLGQTEHPEFLIDSTKTFEYSSVNGFEWVKKKDRYHFFRPDSIEK